MNGSSFSQNHLDEKFLAADRLKWRLTFKRELISALAMTLILSTVVVLAGEFVFNWEIVSAMALTEALLVGVAFSVAFSLAYTLAVVGSMPTLRSLKADALGYECRVRVVFSSCNVRACHPLGRKG